MKTGALKAAFEARDAGHDAGARRAALQALLQHGLPGRRSESWKYTKAAPLAEFAIDALTTPVDSGAGASGAGASGAARDDVDALLAPYTDAWRLVFVDGLLDAGQSRLPEGVRLSDARPRDRAGEGSADDALRLLNEAMPTADVALEVAAGKARSARCGSPSTSVPTHA